jgi:hypothetical protein
MDGNMGIHWQVFWQQTRTGVCPVFRFDEAHTLLGTFLAADVQRQPARFRQALHHVMQGGQADDSTTGNVCTVMMGRERVVVLDALAMDGIGKACALPSNVFLAMLDAWEEAWRQAGEVT